VGDGLWKRERPREVPQQPLKRGCEETILGGWFYPSSASTAATLVILRKLLSKQRSDVWTFPKRRANATGQPPKRPNAFQHQVNLFIGQAEASELLHLIWCSLSLFYHSTSLFSLFLSGFSCTTTIYSILSIYLFIHQSPSSIFIYLFCATEPSSSIDIDLDDLRSGNLHRNSTKAHFKRTAQTNRLHPATTRSFGNLLTANLQRTSFRPPHPSTSLIHPTSAWMKRCVRSVRSWLLFPSMQPLCCQLPLDTVLLLFYYLYRLHCTCLLYLQPAFVTFENRHRSFISSLFQHCIFVYHLCFISIHVLCCLWFSLHSCHHRARRGLVYTIYSTRACSKRARRE
jgi:hypothetical protein